MMNFSEEYYEAYQNLPEKLAEFYKELSFDNHCYLRIALDNVYNQKWDTVLKRPAYKNISKEKREVLLSLLKLYFEDKVLLLAHHRNSLRYRNRQKRGKQIQMFNFTKNR